MANNYLVNQLTIHLYLFKLLGIMSICLNGGPKFLTELIPISKLTSAFLFEQIELTVQAIISVPADVKTIICNSNRVNQAFQKLYPSLPEKAWLTEDNKHLLFDYVHLLKNIRNLWLTEKKTELIFDDDGVRRVAKWTHLKQLYCFEFERLVKRSDLNEISIASKPNGKTKGFYLPRSVFLKKKNNI